MKEEEEGREGEEEQNWKWSKSYMTKSIHFYPIVGTRSSYTDSLNRSISLIGAKDYKGS